MSEMYQICIPANAESVQLGVEELGHYCKSIGFSETEYFSIQVVLAEAVNNIIEHAIEDNSGKERIKITFYSNENCLWIEIIDYGKKLESLPDKTLPGWEAESGRGWPIIYQWMDEVSLNHANSANHLTLKKYM